ncbi:MULTISPECIES: hypothetical protein [unclassified Legionella]|uniref:hypothetical protein n=1 Tax=unclassified Legionella TaxID=2622702 RepID=UPI0010543D6A|nr:MULTISPECIES: hypothetical protein [unclassified Legionella]MDI9819366.1 hypothetical protein [Legionella sp. PL877]
MPRSRVISSKENSPLPTKEMLIQCKEVAAATKEAADYLLTRFEQILKAHGLVDKARSALANIEEFAHRVGLQLDSRNNPWTGKTSPLSTFQNLQQNSAAEAVRNVASTVNGAITMDFAVSDESQFVRGYSTGGKSVTDAKAVNDLDTLFNSWLAKNNMINQRVDGHSVIYKTNEQGQVLYDDSREPVKADPAELRELITDSNQGIQKFLQQLQGANNSVEVNPQSHAYPTPKAEVAETPTVEAKGPQRNEEAPEATGYRSPSSGG